MRGQNRYQPRWHRCVLASGCVILASSGLGTIPTAASAATTHRSAPRRSSAAAAVTAPVAAAANASGYVGRVASATATSSTRTTTATLTVGAAGVAAGDTILGSALFGSTTSLTGAIAISDPAGNAYRIDRDANDGAAKDRLVSFAVPVTRSLAAGALITFTFPAATAYHINLDEFVALGAVDQASSATGTTAAWTAGALNASQTGDVVYAAVGNESGATPTWAAGWSPLPTLTIGKDHLDAGYLRTSGAGAVNASGAGGGTWTATVVAYLPAGTPPPPPPDAPPVAKLAASPASGTTALSVTLNAAASTDTDATPIATYTFDFGDGSAPTTQANPSVTHTYTTGNYTAKVTVTDTANLTAVATTPITVTATPPPPPNPIRVSAGYYDTHHKHALQTKPDPWLGSAGIVFVGQADTSSGGWDSSAIKIDNLTNAPLSGVVVSATIAGRTYALWGTNTIPVGQSLVLAQVGYETFDGSDHHKAGCIGCDPGLCTTGIDTSVPTITVKVGTVTSTFHDTELILSTGGVDKAGCPYDGTRKDESEPWQVVPS